MAQSSKPVRLTVCTQTFRVSGDFQVSSRHPQDAPDSPVGRRTGRVLGCAKVARQAGCARRALREHSQSRRPPMGRDAAQCTAYVAPWRSGVGSKERLTSVACAQLTLRLARYHLRPERERQASHSVGFRTAQLAQTGQFFRPISDRRHCAHTDSNQFATSAGFEDLW